jgi:hypothetical protein
MFLPAIFVMSGFDRRAISFNLSGPFALTVAAMFFSTVKLNRAQLATLMVVMLAPIVGCAFLATSGTLAYEHITFSASTRATSAGYGPNQMSSMLGLGGLLAFLLFIIIQRDQKLFARLMLPVCLWLTVQCVLTYSRGGFWTLVVSVSVAAFYLFRDKRSRLYLVIGATVATVITAFIILPKLEAFTMGTVSKRMRDLDTSGREQIIQSDLATFKKNPLMGVGPGEAYDLHAMFFRPSSAHTEYSRMLAEHGVFGLVALGILLFIVVKRVKATRDPRQKAVVYAFTIWALMFMSHAAMRLAAVSFIFGLGSATLFCEESNEQTIEKGAQVPNPLGVIRAFPRRRIL